MFSETWNLPHVLLKDFLKFFFLHKDFIYECTSCALNIFRYQNKVGYLLHPPKLCFETKMTKVSSKNLFMKNYKNNFIFLPVFYLIMCFMKAPKNFGKIAILKIWELISLGDVKTHFGKLALKWCIFRHETKIL